MTHDTDALVSEKIKFYPAETGSVNIQVGDEWWSYNPANGDLRTRIFFFMRDAIDRLTRERDELAKKLEAIQKGLQDNGCEVWGDTEGNLWVRNLRAEGGEAKLSAAREELAVRKILIADAEADVDASRAELAGCRNKALEEAAMRLECSPNGHAKQFAEMVRALKEAPHD